MGIDASSLPASAFTRLRNHCASGCDYFCLNVIYIFRAISIIIYKNKIKMNYLNLTWMELFIKIEFIVIIIPNILNY